MLWVGIGSIFTFIVFVILLTLGGGEFFKRFDVRIHKKEVAESATAKSTPVDREVAEPIKEKNEAPSQDSSKEKSSDWAEFN
jgi:hypothetical protein